VLNIFHVKVTSALKQKRVSCKYPLNKENCFKIKIICFTGNICDSKKSTVFGVFGVFVAVRGQNFPQKMKYALQCYSCLKNYK